MSGDLQYWKQWKMLLTPLRLKNLYIKFPETKQHIINARESFQMWSALPNVVGVIDGTHVKIKTPVENGPDYFS